MNDQSLTLALVGILSKLNIVKAGYQIAQSIEDPSDQWVTILINGQVHMVLEGNESIKL